MPKTVVTDVLVVGGGLAGLCASVAARARRARVVLVTKHGVGRPSSTFFSVGAFRVAADEYRVEDFVRETLEAGRYVNNPKLVEVLARESTAAIRRLEELGLRFRIRGGTAYVQTGSKVAKGAEIVEKLTDAAETLGIGEIPHAVPLDIVFHDGYWVVPTWCWREDRILTIFSKALVIATGGVAGIYERTTNPPGNVGDGHALAMRAGAKLIEMEFIQFYPFTLAERRTGTPPIPVIRGRVLNTWGEDILEKYGIADFEEAIAKNRDLLTRVVMQEMMRINADHLLLYVELDEENVVNELMQYLGLRQPLKVAPATHFSMGGVLADTHGWTGVPGLFVAGEAMGGIHGANRLANNALTSAAVFGFRAGARAAEAAHNADVHIDTGVARDIAEKLREVLPKQSSRIKPQELRARLSSYAWLCLGPIRSKESIEKFLEVAEDIRQSIHEVSTETRIDLLNRLELVNTLIIATSIARSAYLRQESRGAHFRADYPNEEDSYTNNVAITKLAEGDRIEVFVDSRSNIFKARDR